MKVVSQKNGKCSSLDTFTVSENMRIQDTWFLLLISAILAELRLVGVINGFVKRFYWWFTYHQ
jgi:hypothetical protein